MGQFSYNPEQILAGGTCEDNEFFKKFVTSTFTGSFYFKALNQGQYGQRVNYIHICRHAYIYIYIHITYIDEYVHNSYMHALPTHATKISQFRWLCLLRILIYTRAARKPLHNKGCNR